MPGRIRTIGDAIAAAADLASIADEESASSGAERDAAERNRLLETLGADPTAHPATAYPRTAERDGAEQKTRATRFARDTVDRALVDLLSIHRDALVLRIGARRAGQRGQHRRRAGARGDADPGAAATGDGGVGEARERINLNVAPLLALEAMTITVMSGVATD